MVGQRQGYTVAEAGLDTHGIGIEDGVDAAGASRKQEVHMRLEKARQPLEGHLWMGN